MEKYIHIFRSFNACSQTAFQKVYQKDSYPRYKRLTCPTTMSPDCFPATECYTFDTLFAKLQTKRGICLALTTFILQEHLPPGPCSPHVVGGDFPNTNMYILAEFTLPLPNWPACLDYILKWYQKKGSEIEHPFLCPRVTWVCLTPQWGLTLWPRPPAWRSLKCKVGLPINLTPNDPLNSAERLWRRQGAGCKVQKCWHSLICFSFKIHEIFVN